MTAEHVVVQRAAFAQRHAQQAAFGGVGGLADRLRHLARLAVAEPHPALLVADDDQRGKAEAPAALHHLRHAIDMHELVDKFAVALFPLAFASHACHVDSVPLGRTARVILEVQAALARRIRQRLDAAVIEIAAAVEHHVLDALGGGAFGDELAHRLGGLDVGA